MKFSPISFLLKGSRCFFLFRKERVPLPMEPALLITQNPACLYDRPSSVWVKKGMHDFKAILPASARSNTLWLGFKVLYRAQNSVKTSSILAYDLMPVICLVRRLVSIKKRIHEDSLMYGYLCNSGAPRSISLTWIGQRRLASLRTWCTPFSALATGMRAKRRIILLASRLLKASALASSTTCLQGTLAAPSRWEETFWPGLVEW